MFTKPTRFFIPGVIPGVIPASSEGFALIGVYDFLSIESIDDTLPFSRCCSFCAAGDIPPALLLTPLPLPYSGVPETPRVFFMLLYIFSAMISLLFIFGNGVMGMSRGAISPPSDRGVLSMSPHVIVGAKSTPGSGTGVETIWSRGAGGGSGGGGISSDEVVVRIRVFCGTTTSFRGGSLSLRSFIP